MFWFLEPADLIEQSVAQLQQLPADGRRIG
jgi:hypothetical protein